MLFFAKNSGKSMSRLAEVITHISPLFPKKGEVDSNIREPKVPAHLKEMYQFKPISWLEVLPFPQAPATGVGPDRSNPRFRQCGRLETPEIHKKAAASL